MTIGEAAALSAAKKVVETAAPAAISRLGKKFSKSLDKIKVQFTQTFQDHLAASNFRARWIKTIASKDRPVDLEKIYVSLSLSTEDDVILEDMQLNPCENTGSRFIVSGTGGAGKTVLMKRLLLAAFENRQGVIPLFIELRSLNFENKPTLVEMIYANLCEDGGSESFSLFEAGLQEGIFAIFLDGFDEINPVNTTNAIHLISKFSRRYKRCSIIISSRPGTGLHSLTDYHVFYLRPLSKVQALDLVRKTKFEEVAKSKFLNALDKNLYDQHESMMSIPILVVMMLLTFRSYGDIPDRMTVFYSQAFDTLYSIHDAEGKESYKRVHESGLPPDVFKHVLNAFCYTSLCKYEIEFTRQSLESYVGRGIGIARAECSVDSYISDMIRNVCILQPEGLNYVFVHRSFQEFFAAMFVSRYSGKKPFAAYDQLIKVSGPDLFKMLVEIDRPKLYRQWLMPGLERYFESVRDLQKKTIDEKFKAFSSRLIFRSSSSEPVFLSNGRTRLTSDSIVLAHMSESKISANALLSSIKFDSRDMELVNQKLMSLRTKKNISSDNQLDPRMYLQQYLFEIEEHRSQYLMRSNFNDIFGIYMQTIEETLIKVRKIVEEDVVIEDLIFDES